MQEEQIPFRGIGNADLEWHLAFYDKSWDKSTWFPPPGPEKQEASE